MTIRQDKDVKGWKYITVVSEIYVQDTLLWPLGGGITETVLNPNQRRCIHVYTPESSGVNLPLHRLSYLLQLTHVCSYLVHDPWSLGLKKSHKMKGEVIPA